jgi:ferredoxin
MDYRVHCHICPLKGICPDTIRHIQTSYRLQKNQHHKKQDVEKMAEATRNCPLKALVFPKNEVMGTPFQAAKENDCP